MCLLEVEYVASTSELTLIACDVNRIGPFFRHELIRKIVSKTIEFSHNMLNTE